jgi:hypothetical protein
MTQRHISTSDLDFFSKIQRIAEKFEADLIASGRFKYVRTEGSRKIYVELATGHEVPVLMPSLVERATA